MPPIPFLPSSSTSLGVGLGVRAINRPDSSVFPSIKEELLGSIKEELLGSREDIGEIPGGHR